MPQRTYFIDQLIINSPYEEPAEYWSYDRETRLHTRSPGQLIDADSAVPESVFDSGRRLCDRDRLLRVDSKALEKAEARNEAAATQNGEDTPDEAAENGEPAAEKSLTKQQHEERIRQIVGTIGSTGQTGRAISKPDFRRDAFGRLGRQDGDSHHGSAGLYEPTIV
jgi:hypothetical protein